MTATRRMGTINIGGLPSGMTTTAGLGCSGHAGLRQVLRDARRPTRTRRRRRRGRPRRTGGHRQLRNDLLLQRLGVLEQDHDRRHACRHRRSTARRSQTVNSKTVVWTVSVSAGGLTPATTEHVLHRGQRLHDPHRRGVLRHARRRSWCATSSRSPASRRWTTRSRWTWASTDPAGCTRRRPRRDDAHAPPTAPNALAAGPPRRAGITLVELLVAMMILSIVSLVFTTTLTSVQRAVVREDVRTQLNNKARLASRRSTGRSARATCSTRPTASQTRTAARPATCSACTRRPTRPRRDSSAVRCG